MAKMLSWKFYDILFFIKPEKKKRTLKQTHYACKTQRFINRALLLLECLGWGCPSASQRNLVFALILPVMLGRLCVRHKPWISSITVFSYSLSAAHQSRFVHSSPIQVRVAAELHKRRHHSTACSLGGALNSGRGGGGAASIWHAILPSGREGGGCGCRRRRDERKPGEGSWNAAWDERPARWLHRADSAWLLFGVCSCLAPIEYWTDTCANPEAVTVVDEVGITDGCDDSNEKKSCEVIESTERSGADFKVIG